MLISEKYNGKMNGLGIWELFDILKNKVKAHKQIRSNA